MSERKGTKALELWCKRLVKDCPDVRIENMTTSWRDGMAFCALVHHFRPDLIDISSLKPENVYENNRLAFNIAEKHLGIPALLDPEDMVENDVPDRLSVLTYLSQFYQRLGHTVNNKADNEAKSSASPSPIHTASAPIKFGKTALDKCAACGLPVYLAQRLMVSHKLYHRRCFRCTKCLGHMNPKNFTVDNGSEFLCDSCKNEANLPHLLNNNNDQMGMLAFTDFKHDNESEKVSEEYIRPKPRPRPQSILERISMFESLEKDNVDNKVSDSSRDSITKDQSNVNSQEIDNKTLNNMEKSLSDMSIKDLNESENISIEINTSKCATPEKSYKTNIKQLNFLQTQLVSDTSDDTTKFNDESSCDYLHENDLSKQNEEAHSFSEQPSSNTEENNVTDDVRLAKSHNNITKDTDPLDISIVSNNSIEPEISVPPRRKKNQVKNVPIANEVSSSPKKSKQEDYPEDLNPFSDDEEDEPVAKKESTNPFGSTDEEEDDVPPIQPPPKPPISSHQGTPAKRHIVAHNPFWSDGEEPSSDEEEHQNKGSNIYKSSLTTSTPNLPGTQRKKKGRAPPPPSIPAPTLLPPPSTPAPTLLPPPSIPAISTEDVASISSCSSYNSTPHSDYKSYGKLTPKSLKKRMMPTPPDSISTASGYDGSLERGMDLSGPRSLTDSAKKKGPAPGLPLPERREVKLQMTPEELQVQLDLLETQQLGLERQGVMIEQMIRDKCEGDEPCQVSQEEVEDLVIQLCELVNEKNDLFRKQTELMYIRRQQRLEQEQADIEHEIRVIQSRPAVNRIDSDKAREEQLVSRLVDIVRLRDELVQQMDAERRRERQEDRAIAVSIANKRAQRSSDAKSGSLKSLDVLSTPKKNRVKDKMKKQLKKAKHTLGYKKKDEDKVDKEKKQEKHK